MRSVEIATSAIIISFGLLSATTLFLSFIYLLLFFLQVVKACCFLRNCLYFVEAKG